MKLSRIKLKVLLKDKEIIHKYLKGQNKQNFLKNIKSKIILLII